MNEGIFQRIANKIRRKDKKQGRSTDAEMLSSIDSERDYLESIFPKMREFDLDEFFFLPDELRGPILEDIQRKKSFGVMKTEELQMRFVNLIRNSQKLNRLDNSVSDKSNQSGLSRYEHEVASDKKFAEFEAKLVREKIESMIEKENQKPQKPH